MSHDELMANRVRRALSRRTEFEERRMFGGLAFMVRGHMCCGIVGSELMVRVGPEGYPRALAAPHAREMDFTGRPLAGMVYVASPGLRTERALAAWLRRGLKFVQSLPMRPPKRGPRASTDSLRQAPRKLFFPAVDPRPPCPTLEEQRGLSHDSKRTRRSP